MKDILKNEKVSYVVYNKFFTLLRSRAVKEGILVIEVKPLKQTLKPAIKKKKTKSYIKECITFEINSAKWKSAKQYCNKNGWKFVIITEKDIFSSYK